MVDRQRGHGKRGRAARWLAATFVATLVGLGAETVSSAAWADEPDRVEVAYDFVHRTTLPNGLEVVVIEAPSVPIVTIEIAVHNGAFTEPPELNGLSHLYEHMFFKANAEIPSQEAYLARQRELGMSFNGTTGDERVNYFFTLQSSQLRAGMEFMAAAIQTPLFDPDELVREREVVLGEYDRNEATPTYHLFDRMADLLWYAYPSRKDSLGERDVISTATPEQMHAMQARYYIPNNSVLVLSGDVTDEEGFALAASIFGGWERGADPFVDAPIPEHPPLTGDVASVVTQPLNMSVLQLGWHGPDTRNDVSATYAADVFSFVLAQEGSGFRQRLVETGLLLDVDLSYSTQRYVGPITLTAVMVPGREEAAIAAIEEELARFGDPDYFTDEQVRTAQTLLAVSDVYGQQSAESLAHTLTYWWASASIDYYLGYIESLYAVRREDISRYVSTYIAGRPRVAVLLTSPENAQEQGIDDAWLLARAGRGEQ